MWTTIVLLVATTAAAVSLSGCSSSGGQATQDNVASGQPTATQTEAAPPPAPERETKYSVGEAKYASQMAGIAGSVSEASDGIDAIMGESSEVAAILSGSEGPTARLDGHIAALAAAQRAAKALTVPDRFKESHATYMAGLKLIVEANGHLESALDNSDPDEMRTAREQINSGSILIGEAKSQLDSETAGMK